MLRYLPGCLCMGALSLALLAGSTQAQTVDFEDQNGAGNPIVTSISSGGFTFQSPHFHVIQGDGLGEPGVFLAADGTKAYIGEEGANLGRAFTMTKTGGGSFDFGGFDGAELWINPPAGYPNAVAIYVTAQLAGGGFVNQTYTLDGIIDGPGGAADFQHFTANLAGVTSLTFSGLGPTGGPEFGFAVDNIKTSLTVPEPTATLALLPALAPLGLLLRRRK
ncbi:MAG TPA: hypothetical protein VGN26_07285 [Armatimonadota bacterium]|jgi:hypothetical protein